MIETRTVGDWIVENFFLCSSFAILTFGTIRHFQCVRNRQFCGFGGEKEKERCLVCSSWRTAAHRLHTQNLKFTSLAEVARVAGIFLRPKNRVGQDSSYNEHPKNRPACTLGRVVNSMHSKYFKAFKLCLWRFCQRRFSRLSKKGFVTLRGHRKPLDWGFFLFSS